MNYLKKFDDFILENKNNIVYTALFVNDINKLKEQFKPVHPNLYYHHSTNEFKPKDTYNLEIGKIYSMKVLGRLTTDNVDALIVDNPKSKNKYPHITLSTAVGIKPFQSNDEILNNLHKIEKIDDVYIDVTEGYFDGKNDITENITEKKQYDNEPKPEKLKDKMKGVSLGKGKSGYCVYTHRARSKFYPSPEDIPDKVIKIIETTG